MDFLKRKTVTEKGGRRSQHLLLMVSNIFQVTHRQKQQTLEYHFVSPAIHMTFLLMNTLCPALLHSDILVQDKTLQIKSGRDCGSHTLDYCILGGIGEPRRKVTQNESVCDLLGKEQRSPGSIFQGQCFNALKLVRLASKLQKSGHLVLGRCGDVDK